MSKIKIGVVEDEVIIADSLCAILEQLGYDVLEPASSYTEGLELCKRDKPDLLLLDINLNGKKDGIDLAWKIKEEYDLPFIFLTANADAATVESAKQTDPPAYLVKPFNKDDLYSSIEICIHNFSKRKRSSVGDGGMDDGNYFIKDAIFIKDGYYFHKVYFKDILYLESDNNYVTVFLANKHFMVRTALHIYLKHFDSKKFFRIHRSFVINLDHIDIINSESVIINGKELIIGKTYREELLSRLRIG